MKSEVLAPRRALIIKASALGDIVHALPVLAYLESVAPSMEIGWVLEKPFVALLKDHPKIRWLHVLSTKRWRKFPLAAETGKDIRRFFGELRARKYDLVLDMQGNSKSGVIALATGSKVRYGYDRRNVREWPGLLGTNHKVRSSPRDYHATDRALSVASAALPGGARPGKAGPLAIPEEGGRAVVRRFSELGISSGKTAVFHYGTSWETKLWSLASWKKLARMAVDEMGLEVFLTWGSEAELSACREINRATSGAAMIWPKCGIGEVIALLGRVDLVVGGDTGLIHMAAALGTPTVSLYFATHGLRNGPRGERDRCLQSPMECSPCIKRTCLRADVCGGSIGVAEVFDAMGEVLNRRTKDNDRDFSPRLDIERAHEQI